jgi:hypothetical protein
MVYHCQLIKDRLIVLSESILFRMDLGSITDSDNQGKVPNEKMTRELFRGFR